MEHLKQVQLDSGNTLIYGRTLGNIDMNVAKKFWDILNLSYRGNLLSYRKAEDIKDKVVFFKAVVRGAPKKELKDNTFLACATYRSTLMDEEHSDYKLTAIGCDQTEEGKEALSEIIKNDILNFNLFFWVEASGAIEHLFKKYNGYPIPNVFVKEVLNTNRKIILCEDGVHYKRKIGLGNELFEKMIFGFRDEELLKKIETEFENYEDFRKEINESIAFMDIRSMVKEAFDVINYFVEANEEQGLEDLFPNWYDRISQAISTLKEYKYYYGKKSKNLDWAIQRGKLLLREMPVIRVHTFNL